MPLLTRGQAVAARGRLIVWCRACQHRLEPDTAAVAEEHGAATTVLVFGKAAEVPGVRCARCGLRGERDGAVGAATAQKMAGRGGWCLPGQGEPSGCPTGRV